MSKLQEAGATLPSKPYETIRLMAQGEGDYTVEAEPMASTDYGPMMVIMARCEAVYVTREQAMKFFGFENKEVQVQGDY